MGTRLILIGIGIAAMLDSVVAYVIVRAAAVGPAGRDAVAHRQPQRRDLGAGRSRSPLACALFVPVLLVQAGNLSLMQHGDDSATALGVRVERTRLLTHPRCRRTDLVRHGRDRADRVRRLPVRTDRRPSRGRRRLADGARRPWSARCWSLAADLLGQYAFGTRYPVGVITGALGAPYLVYLLIRTNRAGSSL